MKAMLAEAGVPTARFGAFGDLAEASRLPVRAARPLGDQDRRVGRRQGRARRHGPGHRGGRPGRQALGGGVRRRRPARRRRGGADGRRVLAARPLRRPARGAAGRRPRLQTPWTTATAGPTPAASAPTRPCPTSTTTSSRSCSTSASNPSSARWWPAASTTAVSCMQGSCSRPTARRSSSSMSASATPRPRCSCRRLVDDPVELLTRTAAGRLGDTPRFGDSAAGLRRAVGRRLSAAPRTGDVISGLGAGRPAAPTPPRASPCSTPGPSSTATAGSAPPAAGSSASPRWPRRSRRPATAAYAAAGADLAGPGATTAATSPRTPRSARRSLPVIPRYAPSDMAALFSDEARLALWLEVELLAVEAQAAAGVVPAADALVVREHAPQGRRRVRRGGGRARARHRPRRGGVRRRRPGADRRSTRASWIHFGLTSSDVVDTALCATLVQAADLLIEASGRAGRPRSAAGPSSWPTFRSSAAPTAWHAEPTTFGAKFALWALQAERDRERLVAARGRVAVGKLSGAVGTFSNIDPSVEAYVCAALGLEPVPATQVIARDRHAEYLWACASVGADDRAHRDRGPPPGPQRGGRGGGAVRGGPEGLLVDAAQAQPHPVRAPVRDGPRAARLSRGGAGGRGPLARAGHLAQFGRAHRAPRRLHVGLLHAAQDSRARRRASSSTPTGRSPT